MFLDKQLKKIRTKAKQNRMSVPEYLAGLVKREVNEEWPEGYFELFGTWHGDPVERQD